LVLTQSLAILLYGISMPTAKEVALSVVGLHLWVQIVNCYYRYQHSPSDRPFACMLTPCHY